MSQSRSTTHPLRIAASYEGVLPDVGGGGDLFMRTSAAMARRGHEVVVIAPAEIGRASPPSEAILTAYGTSAPLRVVEIAGTNQSDTARISYHATAVVRHSAARAADVFYVRNPLTLILGLRAGLRCFYDHDRPWGDDVPPLAPLLRRAMTHPNFLGGVVDSEASRQSYLRLGVPAGRMILTEERLGASEDPSDSRAERLETHLLGRYEAHLENGGIRVAATTTWPPKGYARELGRWFAGIPAGKWSLSGEAPEDDENGG